MTKRNVLLVGLGRISSKHIDAIKAHPSLKLWGVCDTNQDMLRKFRGTQVRAFSSINDALFFRSEIGLASIATYSGDHPRHSEVFLRAGVPVLVEKPLSLSLEKAKALSELSEALQVPVFVVKQNRLNPAVSAVIDANSKGSLGDMLFVSGCVLWCRPESYYREGEWRMRRDLDGGVIWNQASHYVDLLSIFMGKIGSVRAIGRNFLSPANTLDTVFVQLENTNGVLGSLEATTAIRPANLEGSMTVCGSNGTVKIGGHALNRIEYWGLEDPKLPPLGNSAEASKGDVYGSSHLGVYESVVDHLNGESYSQFVVSQALSTVAIMDAIDRSIDTNSPVHVREF